MTTCFLAPDPLESTYFIPGSNTPGNGVQLFIYTAGSSTKTTVYKDNAAAVAWTNPIVLDSGGNLPSGGTIWIPQGTTIKAVYAPSTDTDPPASPYLTIDNISGVNDVASQLAQNEWIVGPAPTFVSGTQFTMSGDQTSVFKAGRRVKTTNTGGTVYSTILGAVFSSPLTTVTVTSDAGGMDSGLSAVSYGILASQNLSLPETTRVAEAMVRGRITVVPGQAITSSDVAATTAIYFTPHRGNIVDIYDGSAYFQRFKFNEISTAIASSWSGVRDVFAYSTGSTVALTTVAWTNDTTRDSALSTQNGVPVLASDLTKLYLGTVWTTSGAIPDTASTRGVWNYWNQTPLPLSLVFPATAYTYTAASTGTATVMGGVSTNVLTVVLGDRTLVDVSFVVSGNVNHSTAEGTIGCAIGVDTFSSFGSPSVIASEGLLPRWPNSAGTSGTFGWASSQYKSSPGIGRHLIVPVIAFRCATSVIFVANQSQGASPDIPDSGIVGTILA